MTSLRTIYEFTSDTVSPQRRLRQGDPLSPYLFILAMDVLSYLINRSVEEGRLEGFQLARTGPILTHFFFADDALLFGKASLICGKFVRAKTSRF